MPKWMHYLYAAWLVVAMLWLLRELAASWHAARALPAAPGLPPEVRERMELRSEVEGLTLRKARRDLREELGVGEEDS